jgi:hypothetical protein
VFRTKPRPIVLGVAAWLALAGWRLLLPATAFALANPEGGEPTFGMSTSASAVVTALGCLAFVVPGYVAARAAAHKPLYHALALGVIVAVLSVLVELVADAASGAPMLLDGTEALVAGAITVAATQVGGAIAVWHMRSRGAERWSARVLSLRAASVLLVVALVPYVLIVAALAQ